MELLYHVTKDDSVLGSIERSKAHLDQILHRAGMTFLARSDGKILLQRRSSSNKIFPSCWDSSSSFHVTFGESYEQAARRELKEETGVLGRVEYLGKFSYRVPPENEIVAVFSCKSDNSIRFDQAESSEASFHARDEVSMIARSQTAAPWFGPGWKILATRLFRNDDQATGAHPRSE